MAGIGTVGMGDFRKTDQGVVSDDAQSLALLKKLIFDKFGMTAALAMHVEIVAESPTHVTVQVVDFNSGGAIVSLLYRADNAPLYATAVTLSEALKGVIDKFPIDEVNETRQRLRSESTNA